MDSRLIGCGMCLLHFRPLAHQLIVNVQGGSCRHTEPLPEIRQIRMKARIEAFEEAILKAQQEGRAEDAHILSDLLNILVKDFE